MTTTLAQGAHPGGMGESEQLDPGGSRAGTARSYSAGYKARILAEYEGLDKFGKGVLLRPGRGVYVADLRVDRSTLKWIWLVFRQPASPRSESYAAAKASRRQAPH